jgi:hypothetical protein
MLLVHLSPSQGGCHKAHERPYLRTSTCNGCLGSCHADARRSFACSRSFALTWEKLAPTRSLPLRASFASAYDPISKKVVIFGGFNASNSLNETRTFDGTTWVQVKTSVAPSVRTAASMAYEQKIQKLVLFGGASGFTVLGDTWL